MSNQVAAKPRYDNLDLLKAISIFAVVTLHGSVWNYDFLAGGEITNVIQYAVRNIFEGVPMFVIINGFLLLGKPLDLKRHYSKIGRLFFVSFAWAFIMIVSKSLMWGDNLGVKGVIINLININDNKYNGVWFFISLITLYLLVPLFHKAYSNEKLFNFIFFVSAFFSVGLGLFELIIDIISLYREVVHLNTIYSFFNSLNPLRDVFFVFFFLLGGMIFRYKEKFSIPKVKWTLVALGILAWIISASIGIFISYKSNSLYAVNYNYYQIFLIFTFLGVYALSTGYKNRGNIFNKLISALSRNTMGMYVIHNIVLTIIVLHFNIMAQNFITRVLVSVVITLISLAISMLFKKIPLIDRLVKM
ncbi:MAG: acyltransferase [Oscillospiraceae bacterium]|nr:acyltransferase [Oscillospiraceae bacterium]